MSSQLASTRLGQLLYRAGDRATATVEAGAATLGGGELLKVGGTNSELTIAGPGDIPVAILADGQTIEAGKTGVAAVYFLGSVVKVRAAGAIARGSWVKPAAGGKVEAASTTVTIPAGGTTVTNVTPPSSAASTPSGSFTSDT